MPSARFSHRTTAARGVGEVWAKLQDASTWAAIGPLDSVTDPIHDSNGLRSFRWSATVAATPYRGVATVSHASAPSVMSIDLETRELHGVLSTVLAEEDDNRTSIEVSLTVTSRGFLSTMFFTAIRDAVGNGLPVQVDAFAASFDDRPAP